MSLHGEFVGQLEERLLRLLESYSCIIVFFTGCSNVRRPEFFLLPPSLPLFFISIHHA